jgi:curved DNA-binding protein CbpA
MARCCEGTLYDVLGVPVTADAADIRHRYRQLSLEHHPDKGGDPDTFLRITNAYTILSDSAKRGVYDATSAAGITRLSEEDLERISMASRAISGAALALLSAHLHRDEHHQGVSRPDHSLTLCIRCAANAVSLAGATCSKCLSTAVGKSGKCARTGCFAPVIAGEADLRSGLCPACYCRPRKCKRLGCLTMVNDGHEHCRKHREV